jgi:cardiolipin synthase
MCVRSRAAWSVIVSLTLCGCSTATSTGLGAGAATVSGDGLSLITEPQDGVQPVLDLIDGARHSIDMTMYELDDPNVEQALASKAAAGVSVRVLLQRGEDGNAEAMAYLTAHHVPVRYASGRFALTHQKSIVIDGDVALIMTFNLTPRYYATSRDFGILDRQRPDVDAIEGTFEGDWNGGGSSKPSDGTGDLLWSPGAEPRLLALIEGAHRSLRIENEEMDDSAIIDALCAAAKRGVDIEVTMTYQPQWRAAFERLDACGARVHVYEESASLYIHAKAIVADDKTAYIGSENFSEQSLRYNRELGIITRSPEIVGSTGETFGSDFAGAQPYAP